MQDVPFTSPRLMCGAQLHSAVCVPELVRSYIFRNVCVLLSFEDDMPIQFKLEKAVNCLCCAIYS